MGCKHVIKIVRKNDRIVRIVCIMCGEVIYEGVSV